MPLPTFPPEVWFRICTYLAPAELSSLSQVNKELNEIATDEEHFRRYVPSPVTTFKHPAQLYRRERAMFHPPENFVSRQMSTCITMLCTFHSTLLLVDITKARLIIVPSGLTVDFERLIGTFGNPFTFGLYYADVARNIVILPGNHVAFVTGTKLTRISTLNVKSGQVITRYNGGKRDTKFLVVDGKPVAAAGSNAQYLMYYSDRHTIVLFDWEKGEIARRIQNFRLSDLGKMVGYMMSECPSIDGMSVSGLLSEKLSEEISRKFVFGIGFDGIVEKFRVRKENNFSRMLKSADRKTSVFICTSGPPEYKITGFVGRKKHSDSSKTDYRENLSMETWPELQDNGRVLVAKRRPLPISRSGIRDTSVPRVPLLAVLEDCGLVRKAAFPLTVLPVWSRRISHGLLVLTAGSVNDRVELVNLVEDGSRFKEVRLKRWEIQSLNDMCVVDGHLMFATSLNGKLHAFHFDRFCNGARGVYACPLLDRKKSRDTRVDSIPKKARRT